MTGSHTRSNSVFWAQTARIFLFVAFIVMGFTLIALAVQVAKTNATRHQTSDYMTSPPLIEETQTDEQKQSESDSAQTETTPTENTQSQFASPAVTPQIVPGLAAPEPTETPMK